MFVKPTLMFLAFAGLLISADGNAGSATFVPGIVPATYVQALPSGVRARVTAVDSNGNILLAGSIEPAASAFVAKLAPNGQTLVYLTELGAGVAEAIAVDATGNAYVAGGTSSANFPTTPGAWNTTYSADGQEGFVVKLDAAGHTVYSTLIGGNSYTNPFAIAVNGAGEAFVTGQTTNGFPLTDSPVHSTFPANDYFLVRLSAAGDKPIYSITGPGGMAIAVDEQDNAYIAGLAQPYQIPITANAFQKTASPAGCGGGPQLELPCSRQYVCKVNATATELIFCTLVTGGDEGEIRTSIAVDRGHVIYLAGTTLATQYPVTNGAFQTRNKVSLGPLPLNPPQYPDQYWAFQQTGFFTELSADGTHLRYSTYLGGSEADDLTGIAMDNEGHVYISALVRSPNYPGLPKMAWGEPAEERALPVLTRLDGDGAHSVAVEGIASAVSMGFDAKNGAWVSSGGNGLTHVAVTGASGQAPIAYIADAMDLAPADAIVPGELLTIFGDNIGPAEAVAFNGTGAPPMALGGVSVTIGGMPAPILYVSRNQINLETPAISASQTTTTLSLSAPGGVSATQTLAVSAMNPSLATGGSAVHATCNGQSLLADIGGGLSTYAMVINEDGTMNSCDNPARVGSSVSAFLNAAGVQAPGVTDADAHQILAVDALPGLAGMWRVEIAVDSFSQPMLGGPLFTNLDLSANEVAVREQAVAVWLVQ